ncbi:SDR family oxidoreductase [Cryptosporangium aurantiacum]|uniref:NAD(P)-dependent dehydrogenase, short-chain alcohol dehydrogenase family n=1 Tax=Cryptosporangium aurantiacum TaxID=134849 RepID=A0A1M7RKQ2_9ACTN|nr:NAD(P)-dependent oxidoreductase [Cryptosporangium aurantiacum]SHN46726.1 NAD(P)-dependent dehydrogenase, short-chain alcohol dehydrogenase family [Cryptosporangium aurantiacum]
MNTDSLSGRTILMSGGSRGIGLAIAVAAARQGANVTILAKTDQPDPRLPGTVHTAVAEIEAAGGQALAVVGDVRNEDDVARAAAQAAERFGGIDIVVNNASAINLSGTEDLPVKRFDLMQQINARGSFLLVKNALPALKKSDRPRILTLSPPVNLAPQWLGQFSAYALSKFGMTILTLGWAAEFREAGIAANCLWPETVIKTAAVQNLLGGDETVQRARVPEIMADAAMVILGLPADRTGETFIDVEALREAGVTDFSGYGGGEEPGLDLFVDERLT